MWKSTIKVSVAFNFAPYRPTFHDAQIEYYERSQIVTEKVETMF